MKDEQVRELLYQMLETEMGGVQVYTHAIQCAENEDLKEEWEEYLEQTKKHVEVVQQCMQTLGLDPNEETPGRQVVRHIGESLVQAMEMAMENGNACALPEILIWVRARPGWRSRNASAVMPPMELPMRHASRLMPRPRTTSRAASAPSSVSTTPFKATCGEL